MIGVMNVTIDEKINRLREAVNRLRRYTPVEDFGAETSVCKRIGIQKR